MHYNFWLTQDLSLVGCDIWQSTKSRANILTSEQKMIFATWNLSNFKYVFLFKKVGSLLFQMKTYWGLEPLFIFDMGRGENFNEWLLCVSETMLWVHLSCSGAVGWGTLAAKHEWDEWNHLWQTDTGARAWVIQQNAVLVCISISLDINSLMQSD